MELTYIYFLACFQRILSSIFLINYISVWSVSVMLRVGVFPDCGHVYVCISWLWLLIIYRLQLSYGGKKVALPFNLSILKWATGTREILNKAQLPSGISFYNIFGTSFDTPFDVW